MTEDAVERIVPGTGMTVAEVDQAARDVVDGVYFNQPAEVYHAVPRLSASGIQRLLVSPATFWRGSWLDPERPDLDEEETKAQQLGKAYHVARLEPERFHETYVREISKDDFPARGFLSSDDKVKAALKDLGQQQTVKGETMGERAQRLLDAGYEGACFTLERERWEATVGGRIPLAARFFDQIATDMGRVRASGDIADLLTGGEAEVSIFWTDRHGIRMKARVDYLTRAWWVDFKTMDNSRGRELDEAIAGAFQFNRYHVQASTYRDAAEAVRVGGLQVMGDATDDQRALVANLAIRPKELACHYVFQEKGGVPNLTAWEFDFFDLEPARDAEIGALMGDDEEADRVRDVMRRASELFRRALFDVDRAKREFVLYSQVYEPGQPWFPIRSRRSTSELSFNKYWLEGSR